jgi:hypothetical protein
MASDRWVVVDDTDPSIVYSGPWFLDSSGSQDNVGNFGPPYLETLHGTSADGSVSFEFNGASFHLVLLNHHSPTTPTPVGTAVEVWGTNANLNTTNPDPTLQCFIDDASIGRDTPFAFAENNWRLCAQTGLEDGLHKLSIQVKVQSPAKTFWLDQIRYIPSPTLLLDNRTIMIDNTDPAVQFDANWSKLGGTANITTKQNSIAQVQFIGGYWSARARLPTFTENSLSQGTSISWFAFIPMEWPHSGAQGAWSIDGGQDNQFLLKGLPADATTTVYNQLYFTTPELEATSHTLAVKFLGTNETTPLCLDYLYVKNGTFTHSSTPGTSGTSGTSGPGQPSPSDSGSVGGDTTGGTSMGTPVGAIVGGVLGGLALLLLIAAAFIFYRRRRASQRTEGSAASLTRYSSTTQSMLYQDEPHNHSYDPYASSNMAQTEPPCSPPLLSPQSTTFPTDPPASGLPRKLRNEVENGYAVYRISNPSYS